jgi:NAD(P)-dependent dehydrogenase (short-subunit alcohol dehydrogenase family)
VPQDLPVALVTGGSRGIGRCAALALAGAGHDVVITARTVHEGDGRARAGDKEVVVPGSLETTAAEIEALGRRVVQVPMDLMDPASIGRAFDAALAAWGHIDVLVNNAAYQEGGGLDRILDVTIETAERNIIGDYLSQLRLVQRVVPHMLERGGGVVVNVTSAQATIDPPAPAGAGGWGLASAAGKAAFHRIVPVLHVEYGSSGIRAYNVDPGFVINERMRATAANESFERQGFRGAPPEVPGAVIGWLASSDDARPLAGTVIQAQRLCKDLGLVPGWPR